MDEPGLRVIALFDDDAQAAESTKEESTAWRKNVTTKPAAVDMVCNWERRGEARGHLRELVTRHITAAVRHDTSECLLLCASSAMGDDVLGEILLDALEAATALKSRAFSLVADDFTVADDGAIGDGADRLRALVDHGVEELRRSSSLSLSKLVAWITTTASRLELRPPWCTGYQLVFEGANAVPTTTFSILCVYSQSAALFKRMLLWHEISQQDGGEPRPRHPLQRTVAQCRTLTCVLCIQREADAVLLSFTAAVAQRMRRRLVYPSVQGLVAGSDITGPCAS